jgi:hypothetical protein
VSPFGIELIAMTVAAAAVGALRLPARWLALAVAALSLSGWAVRYHLIMTDNVHTAEDYLNDLNVPSVLTELLAITVWLLLSVVVGSIARRWFGRRPTAGKQADHPIFRPPSGR